MNNEERLNSFSLILDPIATKVNHAVEDIKVGHPIILSEHTLLPRQPEGSAIASLIDHTLLLTQYTPDDAHRVCDEALKYGFATVCVNPIYIPLIAERLKGSP